MSLAQQLKSDALALTAATDNPKDGLHRAREQAQLRLEAVNFPDRHQENWKYTALTALGEGHLRQAAQAVDATVPIPELGHRVIVLCNGQLPETLRPLPDGLTASPIDTLPETEQPDTVFGWLNSATLNQGLRLETRPGACIDGRVHIVFLNTSAVPAHTVNRLLVVLAPDSELTVIEHYLGQGPVLANAMTQIEAGANSRLTHYRLQSEHEETLHIGNLQISQLADSCVDSTQLMRGSTLRRNDVRVRLQESGASLNMRGIFIGRNKTHTDNHVTVEHMAPHCQSNQVYKGIAGEKGRLVFNGRIHIHPYAKGSEADLSNKNLLLSREAEIDSKPELEIYNDDVRCSHGTTIGQMDETQLFYLRTRGIDEDAAKQMLGTGFVNETLNAMPHESIRDWAVKWLGEAL